MRTNRSTPWLCSGLAALLAAATPSSARGQIPLPGLPGIPSIPGGGLPGGGIPGLPGGGGGGPQIVFDPSNLAKNAITAARIVRQVELMVQSLKKLTHPDWRDIRPLVDQLDDLMRQNQAIGYSLGDVDRVFQETFPGYEAAASNLEIPIAQRLQASRALGTMRAVLNVLHQHAAQFGAGQEQLARIKAQMGGIEGTQEALELQNTLGAFLAEEMGLLRQTITTQANLEAVYNAYRINRETGMRANYQMLTEQMSTVPPASRRTFSLQVHE